MNQQDPEIASNKITNPERIARIIEKLCQGHMQALIRTKANPKVGIRAGFMQFDAKKTRCFRFDGISVFGLEKLLVGTSIKVEVVGMSSKVVFVTEIKAKDASTIICSLPLSLVNIERRQNARFRATPTSMAFVSFSHWRPTVAEFSSPPFFDAYQDMAGWIPIVDISAGGICIQSHFPSFINCLEKIDQDDHAHLHLPMSKPLPLQLSIRWKRRIKNRLDENGVERYQLDFRIGVEFFNLGDEHRNRVRTYLRQISVADAI